MRSPWRKIVGPVVAFALAMALISPCARSDEETTRLRTLAEQAAKELASLREKPLKTLPPVERISQKRFVEEYAIRNFRFMWGDRFDGMMGLFCALGLVEKKIDPEPFLRRYSGMMVAAAYDILEGRVLFPETEAAPDVLVHELTHALTDQSYDIKKLMRSTEGELDRVLAMGALIEGEATLVQARYSMGGQKLAFGFAPYEPLRAYARNYSEGLLRRWKAHLPEVPENVLRAQKFVYDEGILFVEKLRRAKRGWDGVEKAYANPPRSTAQILNPERYLAGEWPVEIDVKDKTTRLPGSRLIEENTLGEFATDLFLRTHTPKRKEEAPAAAEGWRGDRVLLYRNDAGKETVVWIGVWETPERAGEVFVALVERMKSFADRYEPFGAAGGPGFFAKRDGRVFQIVVGREVDRFDDLLKDGITIKESERKPPLD